MPDPAGHFGPFGGRYVAETLMSALIELEKAYREAWRSRSFHRELDGLLKNYAGRPTPLYFAERLTEKAGGARIHIKREDLAHTGSHKINNTLGQGLLARRMGKRRIIAETGAGQHGVATATVCARMGIPCEIYMGEEDVRRQSHNVFRMRLLGARVNPVTSGSRTLKDAMNEALRDWVTNVRTTYYLIGSTAGPHPYPEMVRDFQSVIGREALPQFRKAEGKLPTAIVACVGGGATRWGSSPPSCGIPGCDSTGWRREGSVSLPGNTGPRSPAGRSACSTGANRSSCKTRTDRSLKPTRSPRGWTTPEWVRSTHG